ncbi:MAG: hypothetical protein FWD57_09840, partial [Polyangiaceae bacterium]|nr:hypothetical protein [Polyangiaceae bacterium]
MRSSTVFKASLLSTVSLVLACMFAVSCSAGSGDSGLGGGKAGGSGGGDGGAGADGPGAGAAGGESGGGGDAGSGGDAGVTGGSAGDATDDSDSGFDIDPKDEYDPMCKKATFPGGIPDLDVYILLDATASMKGSTGENPSPEVWIPVINALKDLVGQEMAYGMGVGLTYLPVPPADVTKLPGYCRPPLFGNIPCPPGKGECEAPMGPGSGLVTGYACSNSCMPATGAVDCGNYGPCVGFMMNPLSPKHFCQSLISPSVSCDPPDYGKPAVPIAALPGNKNAIVDALNAKKADGDATPTQPALEGTIAYMKEWGKAHPDHILNILFATDGLPNNCTHNNIDGAATVAKNGLATYPPVSTFVLGIGKLSDLNKIAVAGGTSKAYLADGDTVAAELVEVFNEIRANGECQFVIPDPEPGTKHDFDKVNVYYTPLGADEPELVWNVANPDHCDPVEGGWYYDDPTKTNPSKIILCPAT